MGELIASVEEAVWIIAGEVSPAQVHTAAELAARAAGERQRAMMPLDGTAGRERGQRKLAGQDGRRGGLHR